MAALNAPPLPTGWESQMDHRTGRFYFINHREHITTWEDPRTMKKVTQPQGDNIALQGTYAGYYLYGIGRPPGTPNKNYSSKFYGSPISRSSAFNQGGYSSYYGSPRILHQGFYPHTAFQGSPRPHSKPGVIPFCSSPRTSPKVAPKDMGGGLLDIDEKLANRICMQFPTVDEGYIRKMLKKYKNRENVVVSALMSEGHPRAATHNTPELPTKMAVRQIVPVDINLISKLHSIFPTVDEDWLISLLSRHNNSEDEVVASLVSAGYPFTQSPFQTNRDSRSSSRSSSPKMKLRYLKGVFPKVDEAVLFDVLLNCDNQTQDSIARLIGMGYHKLDSPLPRQSVKAVAVPNVQPPPAIQIVVDKVKVKNNLREEFKEVSELIINMALDSTQYNEAKSRQLLQSMTPIDSNPPKSFETPKPAEDPIVGSLKRSRPQSTGDSSASSIDSQPANVTASKLSIASKFSTDSKNNGSPKPPPRTKGISDVKRLSYDLQESKENKPEVKVQQSFRSTAKGPDPTLRKGPNLSLLRSNQKGKNDGPKSEHRKGTNPDLCNGPDKSNLINSGSRLAKGPQKKNWFGSLKKLIFSTKC